MKDPETVAIFYPLENNVPENDIVEENNETYHGNLTQEELDRIEAIFDYEM